MASERSYANNGGILLDSTGSGASLDSVRWSIGLHEDTNLLEAEIHVTPQDGSLNVGICFLTFRENTYDQSAARGGGTFMYVAYVLKIEDCIITV